MTYELITALIAFAFVTSITPGPNNLMLMASGINFGLKRSLPHILGVGIGFIAMIILVGLGLTQLFDAFPLFYDALKIISLIYLSYLAYKIATTKAGPKSTNENAPTARPISFMQAALFQWVNPKAWVMTVTAISTYSNDNGGFISILLISLIFGMVMLPSVGLWTFLGTQMQRFLDNPFKQKAFNIFAGVLLMASMIPALFA